MTCPRNSPARSRANWKIFSSEAMAKVFGQYALSELTKQPRDQEGIRGCVRSFCIRREQGCVPVSIHQQYGHRPVSVTL